MNKEAVSHMRIGAFSVLCGIVAVFFLPLLGANLDLRISVFVGAALGVFLGLTSHLGVSIFMAMLIVFLVPTMDPKDSIFAITTIAIQLFFALLSWSIKNQYQKRRPNLDFDETQT